MIFKDYYKILGISNYKASPEEIKQAYREQAKKYHPDLNVGDNLAEEKIKPKENRACYYTLTSTKSGIPSGEIRSSIVEFAGQFVGNPYVWGKESLTEGTDSSGFTKSVYAHFGVSLPHSAAAQRAMGTKVETLENAEPGDLIFYETPAHAAIYLGDGMVVHAMPETGICISEADFDEIEEIRRIMEVSPPQSHK